MPPIQKAIDETITEINKLPEEQQMMWISYFLESLESDADKFGVLLAIKSMIDSRFDLDSW